jgi:hypothetical protein
MKRLSAQRRNEPMNAQNPNPPSFSPHSSDERTMAALAHGSAVLNLFAGIGGLIAAFVI